MSRGRLRAALCCGFPARAPYLRAPRARRKTPIHRCRARSVVNAFNDAHVAHYRRIAENSQRGLVVGALVSSDRLGDIIEFDHYDRQIDASLTNLGGASESNVASAGGPEG